METLNKVIISIVLIITFYYFIVLYKWWQLQKEIKIWNNGIAPSGKYWKWYNIDSKDRRYYMDEGGNSLCRISFTEVDKGLIYKNLL